MQMEQLFITVLFSSRWRAERCVRFSPAPALFTADIDALLCAVLKTSLQGFSERLAQIFKFALLSSFGEWSID